ncbi:hypothetical protein DFQ09_10372 [Winogradskyella pacifica]|uniref:SnoaL-like protein n=1 Tax=Winogradskyella pacifica TaxID=664642 RepID=A0A3D9MZR8_9FLAO|nr:nuclear transport factor 2 family protein [Winogradskyella pacifica]REE24766.1 hypothetical protein DFQ09_10372 [Winogradskyella pacifica]
MKKLLLIGFAISMFVACQQKESRYTQQSPEIDIVKAQIANYNAMNYNVNALVDTCKVFFNTKDNPILKENLKAYHQGNDAHYSQRGFAKKDQDYEMVLTDDGHTWVNVWLDWQGTLKGNGKVIDMPVHLTYRFVDGKIVRIVGMWDPTEIVLGLQDIEAQNNLPEIEEQ